MKREQNLQSLSILQFANPLWGKETAQIEKKQSEHITGSHNLMQQRRKFQPQKMTMSDLISFIYSVSYICTCLYFFFSIYAFIGQRQWRGRQEMGERERQRSPAGIEPTMFAAMWLRGMSCDSAKEALYTCSFYFFNFRDALGTIFKWMNSAQSQTPTITCDRNAKLVPVSLDWL